MQLEQELEEVYIEKLVFGGQGLAHIKDKPVFVWNALPGEVVKARITKRKSSHWEAIAEHIVEASPHRIDPVESHFLSSSPWGMMDFAYENELKRAVAVETYQRIGKFTITPDTITPDMITLNIVANDQHQYEYRNKIEYSFYERDPEEGSGMALAFFQRNSHYKTPITVSALADKKITIAAEELLNWVNQKKLTRRDIKTMIVRSTRAGQVLAGVFLKNEQMNPAIQDYNTSDSVQMTYPQLSDAIDGIQVYYSTHKSPASVPTALLYQAGIDHLTETVLGVDLEYGLFSFFQVNCPMFEIALQDIQHDIQRGTDPHRPVVDLYSGVGAIGLSLAAHSGMPVTLVESNQEAADFAVKNVARNQLKQCTVHSAPSEEVLDAIQPDTTVIIDPPRVGLHDKVVKRILEVGPQQVMYLSCHVSTQARDVSALLERYSITHSRLYNFFPRTPHIEGLIVLERNS